MKKALAILLICCYALVSSGAAISFHYCGGLLKHVDFSLDKKDMGCCGSKKKYKCCKDLLVKISPKAHHRTLSKAIIYNAAPGGLLFTPCYNHTKRFNNYYAAITKVRLRPPPLIANRQPLYLLHAVFRI